MRRVLFVTGIRSEYDILYSVMMAIAKEPALRASVIVTGAHLSKAYGYTVREIEKDGFRIDGRIKNLSSSDSLVARAKSTAVQLAGLVDVFARLQPDFVVAPMDREEAITVAVAGTYLRIPIVHLGGGDTASDGNVDNPVRHAATKLAHLHFVVSDASAERVKRMGEEAWRVHTVGEPGLDRLLAAPEMPDEEFWKTLNSPVVKGHFAVVIQHSIVSDPGDAGQQMKTTLDALVRLGVPAFVGYPNSDPGGRKILDVLQDYAGRYRGLIHVYGNLPRDVFVNLMRRARVLVGNSSCGIVEAPFLRLPAVNVGIRQRGREHAENVQFVDHDINQIMEAVRRALSDNEYREKVANCVNPYGDGHAGERIAAILREQTVDERLLNKRNTY